MSTTRILATLGFSALLTSCSMFSGGQDKLTRVDDLVGWVERVHVQAELAKDRSNAAFDRLQAIAAGKFGDDPLLTYQDLNTSLQQSEHQAKALRDAFDSMSRVGEAVFDQWSRDLMQFSSLEMRLRSQNRLLETRQRYEAILTAVSPALQRYDGFNKKMRDHVLFLGNDFNAASVTALAADVRGMMSTITDLDTNLLSCLHAARAYVDHSALPVTAPTRVAPTTPAAPSARQGR